MPRCKGQLFHALLRGDDSVAATSSSSSSPNPRARASVVLCHGVTQTHTCWAKTGAALRDAGHDVLLVDLMGHGSTDTPDDIKAMTIHNVVDALVDLLSAVGWDDGRRLVLGGISLGGSACLHFATRFPARVGRLVLVATSGLSEPGWMLSTWGSSLLGSIAGVASRVLPPSLTPGPLHRTLGHMHVVKTAPDYGVFPGIPLFLRAHGIKVSLVSAGLDELHRPNVERWALAAPQAHVVKPFWTHSLLCVLADDMRLEDMPGIFFDAADAADAADAKDRAGLKGDASSSRLPPPASVRSAEVSPEITRAKL